VTAVDIADAALEVARANAREAGVADAITFERHDLGASMPGGPFDLVAATYLHSPVALDRAAILAAAAAAVAPGGTLLVIGHAPSESHTHHDLPTLDDVLGDLALPANAWDVVTADLRTFEHAFKDEDVHERVDAVIRARRRR
jgi:16S rRNA G1207 methylase RsmC